MSTIYRQGGAHCVACFYRWQAVVEMDEAVPLIAGLECPRCHGMFGGWDVPPKANEPIDAAVAPTLLGKPLVVREELDTGANVAGQCWGEPSAVVVRMPAMSREQVEAALKPIIDEAWKPLEDAAIAAISPRQSFRCIVSDPPWAEVGGGKSKRGADAHYNVIRDPADIVATHRKLWADIGGPDPSGCVLWMWATSNHLPDALEVMAGLGFRYVTSLVWVKTTTTGKPHVGLGQRTRQRHELLLLGTMGKVPVPAPPDRPHSVIEAARGKHSEKPGAAFEAIEKAYEGPRLEVFGRAPRAGWTVVGDQAP